LCTCGFLLIITFDIRMRRVFLVVVIAVLTALVIARPKSIIGTGPGFALSGAGGRIPQLLALVESLMTGSYPGKQKVMPSFVSGASSGAITAVTVSLLAESIETGGVNFTWHDMRQQIDKMSTKEVFDDSAEAIALIPFNFLRGFILDNTPERHFLRRQCQKYKHCKFGDLYLPTYISTINQSNGETLRLYSRDPMHAQLDLVDVLMASSAIPMVFRPQLIRQFGDNGFIDGGTGTDMIPVYALLAEPSCTAVYALAYANIVNPYGPVTPWFLNDLPLLYNAIAAFNSIRLDVAKVSLEELSRVTSKPTFSFIPELDQDWGGLDFDHGKQEYEAIRNWTSVNNPTQLNAANRPKRKTFMGWKITK